MSLERLRADIKPNAMRRAFFPHISRFVFAGRDGELGALVLVFSNQSETNTRAKKVNSSKIA